MRDLLFLRLRDKGLVALVALLFSIGLWFRVVGGEKVEATKTVRLDFKVPRDLILYSPLQNEVTVRVRGPAPFVSEFQKQDLVIPVDLSELGTGEHQIGFRYEQFKIPLGIDLTKISPPSLRIFLDREVTTRLAIRPVFSTQLPEDYKIESVVVQPSTVEIRGSRTRLALLNSIPTEIIYITENTLNQHFEVGLNLSDFWSVESTEKISTVHVEVNLTGPSTRKVIKGVPIKLKAGPPSGARWVDLNASHIRLRPRTIDILVEGPRNVVDKMDAASIEVWAHVADLKRGGQQSRLTWRLPPETRILKRSSDSVNVWIPER